MRSLALSVLVLSFVVGVWFLTGTGPAPGGEESLRPTVPVDAPVEAWPHGTVELHADTARPEEATGPVARTADADARTAVTEPAPAVTLHPGRIEVLDEDGHPLPGLDGSLTVRLGAQEYELAVEGGRFEVPLPPDYLGSYRHPHSEALAVTLEHERPVRLVRAPQELRFRADGEVTLQARETPRLMLEVVDAATGAPLPVAQLLAGGHGSAKRLHAVSRAKDDDLIEVRPPLDLSTLREGGLDRGSYRVGAPGHAWQLLLFDPYRSRELRVELEPGADLDLALQGLEEETEVAVELEGLEGPATGKSFDKQLMSWDGESPARLLELTGLPPGRFRVTVRERAYAALCGQQEFELPAGARRRVTVTCSQPDTSGPLVPARILLHLPPELDTASLLPKLRGLDPGITRTHKPTSSVRIGSALELVFPPVLPGSYRLTTVTPDLRFTVEVPPEGLSGLELRLPAMLSCTLEVLDDKTDEPVKIPMLRWTWSNPRPAEDEPSRVSVMSRPSGDLWHHNLRMPAGKLTVTDAARGAVLKPSRFVLEHDGQVLRAKGITKTWPFALVLSVQGASIPFEDLNPFTTEVEGPGKVVRYLILPSYYEGHVSRLGTYTLRLP